MTLESTNNKNRYIGNGATTQFPFTFKIWEPDQIKVFVGDGKTEADATSLVTVAKTATGGSVTFSKAPKSGQIIVIRRNMPFVQEDDYVNGSRFNSEEIEDRFDRDCAERQDLLLDISRSLKVPETSSESGDAVIGQLFQARDDVLQALAQIGDVTGATRVTAAGSTTPRAIQDRFSDFINVNDYGAAGDGVTDDAAAIQRAIDAGPNKKVIFPSKKYRICSTLHFWGNQGGQDVDFCGALIVWDGDTDGTMITTDKTTSYESKCHFHNGTFDGQNKARVGIVLDTFHAHISNVKIINCTEEHLAIGHQNGSRSLQCHIEDVLIMLGGTASAWADGNSTVGVVVYEPDNFFSNINVNRCNKSIYLVSTGNIFVNCHFTAEYKEELTSLADTYAVYVNPVSQYSIGLSKFTNCYFDCHKYCFFAPSYNRLRIDVENSYYFSMSGVVVSGNNYSAFMLGGYGFELTNKNFTVVPASPYCRFFNANLSCHNGGLQLTSLIVEKYNKTIYSLVQGARLPYLGAYLVSSDDRVTVVTAGEAIEEGTYRAIGCLVLPDATLNNLDRFTSATITYFNRSWGSASVKLYYNPNLGWQVESDITTPNSLVFSLAIGSPVEITVNGIVSVMIPLYMHALTDITSTVVVASIETDGLVLGYLVGDTPCNWSSTSYLFDVSQGIEIGKGKTYALLNDIGCTIDSTLVEVCSKLPKLCNAVFQLQQGGLFNSLPGDSASFVKFLKISRGGTNICEVTCSEVGMDDVTYFVTFVNVQSSNVATWKELS